jgi:ABC-type transport system, involved in lipoprotein release, permease component
VNSYLDLVGESGKVHKKKNRITVLCIAVAVCLVTAIFGMAEMAVRTQEISAIKTYGNYHAAFRDIPEETEKLIASRADVAVSGRIVNIGSDAGYLLHGKPLALVGADEAISGEMGLTVMQGHFPQKNGECLLDRQALEAFSLSVGKNVSVTLPDGSSRTFTISGTFSDFSSLKKEDVHGLVLAYGSAQSFAGKGKSGFYVQFKGGTDLRRSIDEIKKIYRLTDAQVVENNLLVGLAGQSRDSYALQLYAVAGVLFLLVLFAGVLMIAGSFNMNVLERIRFFGLMRCLGASKKQVERFVLLEGICLSLKGIPLGLLTGTVLVWASSAVLKYRDPAYFSEMPLFGVSWISLISGVAVGFLTVLLASFSPCRKAAKVSPLSAVMGNLDQSGAIQSRTAVKTAHRADIAMGIHHAFSGKKNIFLMTGSFAISIILFLSFSVTVDFMHHAIRPLKPYTPDLSVLSSNNTASLSPALSEEIKAVPNVKRVYGRMFAYDLPIVNGGKKVNLISYEENQFNWAKQQLIEGGTEEAENGTDSVLAVYDENSGRKVGDTLVLKLPSGEKKVRVSGILSSIPFDQTSGTENIICSERTFEELAGKQGYTVIDIQLENQADDGTAARIRGLTTDEMRFSDRRQSNEEGQAAFYTYAVFIYGFLAIIALITVFHIINSMNNSTASRMNLYGVMRAVGMSGKQLRRMVAAEACSYAVCGCLAGCVLGLPLHRLLFTMMVSSHWGGAWQVPLSALAVILAITVLSTVLSVIGPVRKINRMDIVRVIQAL